MKKDTKNEKLFTRVDVDAAEQANVNGKRAKATKFNPTLEEDPLPEAEQEAPQGDSVFDTDDYREFEAYTRAFYLKYSRAKQRTNEMTQNVTDFAREHLENARQAVNDKLPEVEAVTKQAVKDGLTKFAGFLNSLSDKL